MAHKRKIITIWTWGNRPFVMGGKVEYVMACEVLVTGPYNLGKGYKGYLATAPDGSTVVAESKSGALIGPNLTSVRIDIAKGKARTMKEQVKEAISHINSKEVTVRPEEFFWKALNREKIKRSE